MKNLLIELLIFSLCSVNANANLTDQQIRFYSSLIKGGANLLSSASDWRSAEEKQCQPRVEILASEVAAYQREAYYNNDEAADQIFLGIKREFLDRFDPTDLCDRAVMRSYLMMAAGLLQARSSRVGLFLVHVLFEHNLIGLLSDSQRDDFGPRWKSTKLITGAYDCKTSKIWLDPFHNRPFDLASTIFHEIGHLFRDKFSDLPVDTDISKWILLDETSSAVTGAFLQRRLTSYDIGTLAPEEFWDPKYKVDGADGIRRLLHSGKRSYLLKRDLQSYRPKGDLWTIFSESVSGVNDSPFSFMIDSGFWGARVGWSKKFPNEKQIQNIYDLVSQVYLGTDFAKRFFVGEFLSTFDKLTPLQIDPFGYLIDKIEKKNSQFSDSSNSVDQLITIADQLLSKLGATSVACEEIARRSNNPKIRHYLNLTQDPTIRPGGEGVKTSIPLHPCLKPPNNF